MAARFTVPEDPVALRMENDLLALEIEHLRGQASSVVGAAAAEEIEELRAQLVRAQGHLAAERERVAELARARSDLRWLLQRLDSSLAGSLLRRYEGFRTLAERWLDQ